MHHPTEMKCLSGMHFKPPSCEPGAMCSCCLQTGVWAPSSGIYMGLLGTLLWARGHRAEGQGCRDPRLTDEKAEPHSSCPVTKVTHLRQGNSRDLKLVAWEPSFPFSSFCIEVSKADSIRPLSPALTYLPPTCISAWGQQTPNREPDANPGPPTPAMEPFTHGGHAFSHSVIPNVHGLSRVRIWKSIPT